MYPPLVTFDEIPEYRRINHLNATLHLIINKFIRNQQKTVLNSDFRTNNFTTNQHKTGLNTVLNFDFITNLGRFLTNNFITNQQIITNQQTNKLARKASNEAAIKTRRSFNENTYHLNVIALSGSL